MVWAKSWPAFSGDLSCHMWKTPCRMSQGSYGGCIAAVGLRVCSFPGPENDSHFPCHIHPCWATLYLGRIRNDHTHLEKSCRSLDIWAVGTVVTSAAELPPPPPSPHTTCIYKYTYSFYVCQLLLGTQSSLEPKRDLPSPIRQSQTCVSGV